MSNDERAVCRQIMNMGDPSSSASKRLTQMDLWSRFVRSWEARHPGAQAANLKPVAILAPPKSPAGAADLLREACLELIEPMMLSHLTVSAPEWREHAKDVLMRAKKEGVFADGETLFGLEKM